MLKTLYGRLAIVLMAAFIAISALMILASQKMIEAHRLLELATDLIIGTAAFSLIAALIVFRFLTIRLRILADSIDAFRACGFSQPVQLASADQAGDEIARLGAAFQEMSQRIASQLKQLEQADQQRRELIANVSHDLRTPLTSMQGYLETMLINADNLSPQENRQYLRVAARHCERLGKLVHDLFELTKLEACQARPKMEIFPLAELAQDVLQKFALTAQKYGLKLAAGYQPDCVPVWADIGMMERAMDNLIENAMRYTDAGGEIRIDIRPSGDRVELRVSDTGKGMPGDQLSRIFERYHRAHRCERNDGSHAGLGLAITRRIAELHGGGIRVESIPGRGSTFIIDLPMAGAMHGTA